MGLEAFAGLEPVIGAAPPNGPQIPTEHSKTEVGAVVLHATDRVHPTAGLEPIDNHKIIKRITLSRISFPVIDEAADGEKVI